MRIFSTDAATAVIELKQMLLDLSHDIDINHGVNAWEFYTEQCTVVFGALAFAGQAGVKKFYADRLENIRLHAKDGRTTRHTCANVRAISASPDRATVTCLIVTYGGDGKLPIMNGTTPIGISDSRYECERGSDRQWRIAGHFGSPIFVSDDPFVKRAAATP